VFTRVGENFAGCRDDQDGAPSYFRALQPALKSVFISIAPFARGCCSLAPVTTDRSVSMPPQPVHPNEHPNREAWLADLVARLRLPFQQLGSPLPDRLRIGVGFPSGGAKLARTGECWPATASEDGCTEIWIRPDLPDTGDLAADMALALVSQLIQVAVGVQAGRGRAYRKVAVALGLNGSMRAPTPGPAFRAMLRPILEAAGPVPHARLDTASDAKTRDAETEGTDHADDDRPRSNRHLKCSCANCGYLIRTARQWIDKLGPPFCPSHGRMSCDDLPRMAGVSKIAAE
jgi:hypothetical protein